jgi:hypothetical protein
MNSPDPLHQSAAGLMKAAQAFHSAADLTATRPDVPLSLARTEEALQLLSGAWYQLAAEASGVDGLSREQQTHLIATLHDVAAALARCARSCREGRVAVTPVLAASAEREEMDYEPSRGKSVAPWIRAGTTPRTA